MADLPTPSIPIIVYNLSKYGIPKGSPEIEIDGRKYCVVLPKGLDEQARDKCMTVARRLISENGQDFSFLELKINLANKP